MHVHRLAEAWEPSLSAVAAVSAPPEDISPPSIPPPPAPDFRLIPEDQIAFPVIYRPNVVYGSKSSDALFAGYDGSVGAMIFGLDGDDFIVGSRYGSSVIDGGAGRDTLLDNGGANILNGGQDNDRLIITAAGTTAIGGQGADEFVLNFEPWSKGVVFLPDFNPWEGDVLNLSPMWRSGVSLTYPTDYPELTFRDGPNEIDMHIYTGTLLASWNGYNVQLIGVQFDDRKPVFFEKG